MTGANPNAWPSEPRRVVVTGMGLVTSLGMGVETAWDGLVAGQSGVRTIEAFDPPLVLAGATFAEYRDGRISTFRHYFDDAALLEQMLTPLVTGPVE